MSILKYKYKAHKLINSIFYIIIFLIGFGIGFGANKIDFNKLINQFLMIDNVQAYTIEYQDYSIDENDILNKFKSEFDNFDINTYNKIICTFVKYSNYGYTNNCYASSKGYYLDKYDISVDQSAVLYTEENSDYYRIHYILSDDSIIISQYIDSYTSSYGTLGFVYLNPKSSSNARTYTNFNIDGLSDELNKKVNVFDFGGVNLKFNENLFKDNPDFKKVCIDEGKAFAITSTELSDINSAYDFDFIWFPYNLNGLSKILYDSSVDTNEVHFTEDESKERYFYNTKQNIDSFYSDDVLASKLNIKGYTDKYSYYGWSAWPFRAYYSESVNQFNIFELKEPTKIYIGNLGSGGSVHGGGGLRLDDDEDIVISNEYCFYIKNMYQVTEVNIDEWGDYYGTAPTPNGNYDFDTSYIKLNSNTDKFLSQPINFINSMKDTINFINSLIYEFYMSLPVLLRTFIITLFIILIIMLLMKIGGYK